MLTRSGADRTTPGFAVSIVERVGLFAGAVVGLVVLLLDVRVGSTLVLPLAMAASLGAGDQATGRLPNSRTGVLFVVSWLLLVSATLIFGVGTLSGALLGSGFWAVPFFAMAFAGSAGGGDFKFAASLGAMCGWFGISTAVAGLMVALLACCVVGVIEARRAGTLNTKLHLGLPLFVGASATIVFSTFG